MSPASSGTAIRATSDAMSAFMDVSLSEREAEDGGELVVLRLAQVAPVLDHRLHVRVDEEAEGGVEGADGARFRIGRAEVLVAERRLQRRQDDVVALHEPGVVAMTGGVDEGAVFFEGVELVAADQGDAEDVQVVKDPRRVNAAAREGAVLNGERFVGHRKVDALAVAAVAEEADAQGVLAPIL